VAFELTIAEGKGRGQRFRFDAAETTIGRDPASDLVLSDPGVSRSHARIRRQGEAYLLFDGGSSNGTELNGSALREPAPLCDGDRIGVGPVVFEFAVREAPRTDAPTRISRALAEQATRISAAPAEDARQIAPRAGLPGSGGIAWFAGLPRWKRLAAFAAAGLLLIAFVRLAAGARQGPGTRCPEVVALDDETASYVFGHGAVDVDCGDSVRFGFNAPARTRVLFRYVPGHVATPSELELRLNGQHLAWSPVAASRGEMQVLPLPDELLAPDGRNLVSFAQGQPGKEFSVSKVRVELLARTPGDLSAAREAYERGRRKLEERRVAPRNLYDAWKSFALARRYLEGLAPRPPLHHEVVQLIEDAERELHRTCGKLLFTAARFERYGRADKAQTVYREVLLHFPGDDPSGCRKKAQAQLVSAGPQDGSAG